MRTRLVTAVVAGITVVLLSASIIFALVQR
jgi:hypothetical protein